MVSNRVTYTRSKSYNTKSNKIQKLRTPGGRLTIKYIGKTTKGPQTGVNTKAKLTGLRRLTNAQYGRTSHNSRCITRPYGGVLTPRDVKERIMRAFLIEEVKVVKRVRKEQELKNKKKN
jgi:large subunit ribosomal protein L34e